MPQDSPQDKKSVIKTLLYILLPEILRIIGGGSPGVVLGVGDGGVFEIPFLGVPPLIFVLIKTKGNTFF